MTKVIVAQLGARHNYFIPRILYKADALSALYTDFCLKGVPANLVNKIHNYFNCGILGKLQRRTVNGITPNLIKSDPWINIKTDISRKSKDPFDIYNLQDELFSEAMLRWGTRDATAVYAMFANGQSFLEHARSKGLRIFVDVFITPVAHEIEEREKINFPDWEPPQYIDNEKIRKRVNDMIEVADLLICPSQTVVDGLRTYENFNIDKASIVPYGNSIIYRSKNKPLRGRVLFAGTACLRKGIHYLAKTAELLKEKDNEYDFRVAGGVSDRIRNHPEAINLKFLGHLSRDDLTREFLRADVFVLPTLAEGSASVVYEALAAGVPVVTTKSAGSVVTDGIEGFIVKERDFQSLAEGIQKIVNNRDLRDGMSRLAVETAEKYNEKNWQRQLLNTMKQVDRNCNEL